MRETIDESIIESTVAASIPNVPTGMPSGKMACGTPYFDCDDKMFYSLHLRKREKGKWYKNHYQDTEVASWARKNKGKAFYLKHNTDGFFRKVK